jgi:hypothetical protein
VAFIGALPREATGARKPLVDEKRYATWDAAAALFSERSVVEENSAVARLTIIFPRRCAGGL